MVKEIIKLQCGWEDGCKTEDCLSCPRKHIVKLELSEAEISCIEDIGVCDISWFIKEKPEVFDLLQNVMRKLMKKVFREIEEEIPNGK